MADIFERYARDYRLQNKLPLYLHKVINELQRCRTKALGGHMDVCNQCGHQRPAYNSCRNRHCPKCQGMQQLKWADKRTEDLLPTGYFHLVFTIPAELNPWCRYNKQLLYDILFHTSRDTVIKLAADPQYLGAQPAIIAVLHTWGQNLMEHPHIHMLVSGGGLSKDRTKWVGSSGKYFIPVKVLSVVFRAKFLEAFKKAWGRGQLQTGWQDHPVKRNTNMTALLKKLYAKPWVVYAKKPFGNPQTVIRYLGRYTHRIAIANHRIQSIDGGMVRFSYKDYADGGKKKIMQLTAQEFIRRFLLHVLPHQYFKIRYYGLMANRFKRNNLVLVYKLLKQQPPQKKEVAQSWQEVLLRLTGFDVRICPQCKKGKMTASEKIWKLP